MAGPTRELQITYGTFTIGPPGRYLLDGAVRIEKSRDRARVSFAFVIAEANEAAFAYAVAEAEDAFRRPYQDLVVRQGAQVILSARPSSNEGFDTLPTIRKSEDPANTGRSRRYEVEIEAGLPADNVTPSGLRDSSVTVAYSPSRRRTVTIRGTYTAVGSSAARATYDAGIAAFCSSVLEALSVSFSELAEEPITRHDRNNKTLEFERVYEELIFPQAGASTYDDPDIVRQVLRLRARDVNPGDSRDVPQETSDPLEGTPEESRRPSVRRLRGIELNYEAWINKSVTTNLTGKLDAIRPWLLDQIRTKFAGTAFALVEEEKGIDPDDNRITARMVAWAPSAGQKVFERRVTTEDHDVRGKVIVPVWNGDEFGAYVYQGPRIRRRTLTIIVKSLSSLPVLDDEPEIRDSSSAGAIGGGGGWITIEKRDSTTPITIGVDGNQLEAVEGTTVLVRQRVHEVSGGSSSSGAPALGGDGAGGNVGFVGPASAVGR